MTPRAFATVLVRVLGLWLAVDALCRIGELAIWASSARQVPGSSGWTSYPPIETTVGTSELYLHDTYYFISATAFAFLSPALKFLVGLLFFCFARRTARLLCSGVE